MGIELIDASRYFPIDPNFTPRLSLRNCVKAGRSVVPSNRTTLIDQMWSHDIGWIANLTEEDWHRWIVSWFRDGIGGPHLTEAGHRWIHDVRRHVDYLAAVERLSRLTYDSTYLDYRAEERAKTSTRDIAIEWDDPSPGSYFVYPRPEDQQRFLILLKLRRFVRRAGVNDASAIMHLLGDLAERVPLKFINGNKEHAKAREGVHQRAKEEQISYEEAKRQTISAAALTVLGVWQVEQSHRFGSHGKKEKIVPSELHWIRLWEWLGDEIVKAALADLLDKPYPTPSEDVLYNSSPTTDNVIKEQLGNEASQDPRRTRVSLDTPWGADMIEDPTSDDPLGVLLHEEAMGELGVLLEQATSKQREVVALMDEGLSTQEIAARMRTGEGAVRQHLRRLRERLLR